MNGFFFNPPVESINLELQLKEIYTDKVYDFLRDKSGLTILDVGGNVGMTSYFFSRYAKDVYTIEPSPEHFEILNFMISFNKLENIHTFNMAVTNKDGESTLFHNANKTMFSLNTAIHDPRDIPDKVKTIRLDTFLNEQKIDHVDFMKLDVEGVEPEILCGDGFQNIASKIDSIIYETHAWMDRNPNQIVEALKMAGYSVKRIPTSADVFEAKRI